jgi:hypothetical protein
MHQLIKSIFRFFFSLVLLVFFVLFLFKIVFCVCCDKKSSFVESCKTLFPFYIVSSVRTIYQTISQLAAHFSHQRENAVSIKHNKD